MPDYQGGPTNPERHRPFMEMFERHMRYSAPSNPHHQWTPAEEIAWRYGRQCLPAFDNDMTGMPIGVNPGKAQRWAFDVMELFPNIFWLLGNHFHVEAVFWPIDADNTLIVGANYGYKSKDAAERLSQEFPLSRGRIVLRECLSTLEAQHAALKVRRVDPLPAVAAGDRGAAPLPRGDRHAERAMSAAFPKGFEELETFAPDYALATPVERQRSARH